MKATETLFGYMQQQAVGFTHIARCCRILLGSGKRTEESITEWIVKQAMSEEDTEAHLGYLDDVVNAWNAPMPTVVSTDGGAWVSLGLGGHMKRVLIPMDLGDR